MKEGSWRLRHPLLCYFGVLNDVLVLQLKCGKLKALQHQDGREGLRLLNTVVEGKTGSSAAS
eukprot:13159453-Ditylum_brightwellii.AAC.1